MEPAALLGMANVASLFLVGLLIGGSAVLGKVVAGRYFVGDHGHYTEVPQWVWIYSWAHAVSQVGTVPFIFIWGLCVARRSRMTREVGPPDFAVAGPPNTRVQRTRSSPSAHRSPLTRSPLGRSRHRWA